MTGVTFIRILALCSGAATLGLIGNLLVTYLREWHRRSDKGQVPLHVIGIGIYAAINTVKDTEHIHRLLHQEAPLTPFGLLMLLANIVLYATFLVSYYLERERRRIMIGDPSEPLSEDSPT